ncbi:hypothetical protein F5Y13DRAFT_40814 [Hypoxylon sp. FL1857]|nr:hypothetical protein F5Y13DRAFT_40814 [Hypoxylon sp. FL1857]
MCHKDVYTYVYPDGHRVEQVKHDLCVDSRHGQPCKLTKEFQHPVKPVNHVPPSQLSPPAFTYNQFPPTPPLSSHSASASDSEHSSKERSGVYVKGEKVIDLNKRSSRRDRTERPVYGESPPLSHTPPRRYSISRGSPSSPREETVRIHESPRRRENSPEERDRPTSSHFRPTIEVKVVNEQRHNNTHHRRHGSSSKSSSQDGDEEERRRRRRNSHVRFEDDEKKKKIQSEIERENEAIAKRPPVPAASAQLGARYRRGSVVVPPAETSLVAAMDHLTLEREQRRRERRAAEQKREREERREREEEEAQKQRLKDRMAPGRRATISHGNGRARQKVLYDDGMYYWE